MYEIYCQLRDAKGCKDAEVARCAGIAKSTLSDWKNGKSNPKQDKLQKIADFFGVSVDYLMTGKEPNENKYSSEMATLIGKLRNDKAMSEALLKYFELSDDKKKHVVDTINMLCEGK